MHPTWKLCLLSSALFLGCQTKPPASVLAERQATAAPPQDLAGYHAHTTSTQTNAGRYEGWLVTPSERFLVSLDLLDTSRPGHYQGIFALVWGPTETTGFHLKAVKVSENGMQVEHDFLKASEWHIDGDQITGEFFSRVEERGGEIFLARRQGRAFAQPVIPHDVLSRPIGTSIAGSYHGTCGAAEAVLQFETFPWRQVRADAMDWFDHVQVRARIGLSDDLMCEKGSLCIVRQFTSAKYFTLDGKLQLQGRGGALDCTKSGTKLDCGTCSFEKQNAEAAVAQSALPVNQALIDRSGQNLMPQTAVETSGQYFGYLHHEVRDTYQLVALSVTAKMDDGILSGQAVLTAFLGEGDSTEFSVFRFDDFAVPETGLMTWDGGADPILRLAHWHGGIIRGHWFSKNHGRIGELQLVKDGVPRLPSGLRLESPLSGTYRGGDAEFAIMVTPEIADKTSSLFPLRVFGNAVSSGVDAHRRRIEEIRYDVFLGRVGLIFDDGRLVTGERIPTGFDLVWPPDPRFGRKIGPWRSQTFLQSGEPSPQARR